MTSELILLVDDEPSSTDLRACTSSVMAMVSMKLRGMPSVEVKPVDVAGLYEVQELTRAFNSMVRCMAPGW